MTNDENALINQINESRWLATNPSYRERQHKRYRDAIVAGWQTNEIARTALDAIWCAASDADMLTPQEHSYMELTPARVAQLIALLGWE